MNDKVKKIIGGALALAGAIMAFSTNKEEKKSETTVEGSNSSETNEATSETNDPTEDKED